MTTLPTAKPKAQDYATPADVRWCPGCGDYSILKQVQTVFAELELERKDTVFVSGIGCSSRFPYYMNTYGLHGIHGRPLPIALGLKTSRPELNVWVVTGDGDGLSIGGNHLLHTLRRNPELRVLFFNNQIYGLTKGQISPTSEFEKVTRSTPYGGLDHPLNPLMVALAAEGSFVARTLDRNPTHLRDMLKRTASHKGTGFLEIYQNCNIFNDGAFDRFSEKETKDEDCVFLEHGKPLKFGKGGSKAIVLRDGKPVAVTTDSVPESELWIHDEHDLMKAMLIAQFDMAEDFRHNGHSLPRPFGVLFSKERPTYESLVKAQIEKATADKGPGSLTKLLHGSTTWKVD